VFRLLYTVPTEPFDDPGLEEMRQSALADDSIPIRFAVPDWWETPEEEFIEKLREAYAEMGRTVTISVVDGEPLIQVGPPTRGAGLDATQPKEETRRAAPNPVPAASPRLTGNSNHNPRSERGGRGPA